MLDRFKHTRLLRKYVNYGRKEFYSTGPWFTRPSKGAFTLAQFHGQFCTKLACLVMKKISLAKRASLMRNRVQNLLM